ncbi:Uma2 family endonuclease [Schaedlerella arabinosiphila]|uniref:Uma2 family endonuclease n=1 Tax=Schaedlerella arabinosiphila TaxID=2044587 RepID=UPI002557FEF3|nr:Uma2 family endonuclease [Schaedlerella arabinosiphila]
MNGNLAYQEDFREEMLGGKIYMMSSPSVNHNRVASHIFNAFFNYLKGKPCEAFSDGTDVFLTDEDRVIPDVMIICNKDIIEKDGIHGAPDLVVEVLSPGTAKNDKGYKKDLYEKVGVKEYWIVDPSLHSIESYLLSDGKYKLDGFYGIFPDGLGITEKERAESKKEIPVSLYSDFTIPLEEIFYNLFE